MVSAVSALAQGALFLKSLYTFAQKMQQLTGVELQGITSLLGEYTLIDASAEDLNRIADVLEVSSMSEVEAKELYALYWDVMGRFKRLLIDILLAIKEITWAISLGVAIALTVLPVETAFKEYLFYTSKKIIMLREKRPRLLNIFMNIVETTKSRMLPVIGFLLDNERIVAFSRIDDAMAKLANRTAKDTILDTIGSSAEGGKIFWDVASSLGDDIASGVADIKFEGKTYNFDKFKIY